MRSKAPAPKERLGIVKIVVLAARILLGLAFLIFGLNGFLHFFPAPPMSGLVATFLGVLASSHYYVLIFAVQAIAGILLLTDQYVTLALTMLAAVLANIFTFHITMQPQGLPLPIVVTVLWFIVAWSRRSQFAALLARKPI